jgi:hypothetical protein
MQNSSGKQGVIDDSFSIIKGAQPESLRICTFNVKDGDVLVRWKSVAGEKYRVERSVSVDGRNWTPAGLPVTATGATTSWTDPMPAGASQSFYRVVRLTQPPPPPDQERASAVPKSQGKLRKALTKEKFPVGRR